ncbi:membrane protein [Longimycelium tulufanense]|uniref:Membrane protein n=1 Tax=Longimycelium tulufanense TaxID=907463 RepID=A0A8J3CIM4_9PSEU|nr:vitamin K epoxide reductase family protein [Longimycelium tulufanense]GGM82900.1 membrane protein [Longimycelium tulufanense]
MTTDMADRSVPAEDIPDLEPGWRRFFPGLLAIAGVIGWASAFLLTIERLRLYEDPTYIPSCSVNAVLSCGSVMQTPQASVFGFPNPLIGLAGFAVVITIGVAALAGAWFPRWIWLGLLGGSAAATVFIHWLIFQSIYEIGALCPYCMVVWVVTIPTFWYTLLHVLDTAEPKRGQALTRFHWVPVVLWYVLITALVLERFWLNAPAA